MPKSKVIEKMKVKREKIEYLNSNRKKTIVFTFLPCEIEFEAKNIKEYN